MMPYPDLASQIIAWSAWVICVALLANALYQAFRGLRLWRTLGALLVLLPLIVVEQIALAGRTGWHRLTRWQTGSHRHDAL